MDKYDYREAMELAEMFNDEAVVEAECRGRKAGLLRAAVRADEESAICKNGEFNQGWQLFRDFAARLRAEAGEER